MTVGSLFVALTLALSATASSLDSRATSSWAVSFYSDNACGSQVPYSNVTLSGTAAQKCQTLGPAAATALVNDTHSDKYSTGVYSIALYTDYDCKGNVFVPLQSKGTANGDHWTLCRAQVIKSFLVGKTASET